MSLAPLLNASPTIQVHAFAAMAAFAVGVVQLSLPKGTFTHRTIGWIWVVLMLAVSVSAFVIPNTIRQWQVSGLIYLLAVLTLVTLPIGVLHARRHRIERHRRAMISIFVGALVIAGVFTLLPGRIMHAAVFGH
jgi:uncharacterized membrane protein